MTNVSEKCTAQLHPVKLCSTYTFRQNRVFHLSHSNLTYPGSPITGKMQNGHLTSCSSGPYGIGILFQYLWRARQCYSDRSLHDYYIYLTSLCFPMRHDHMAQTNTSVNLCQDRTSSPFQNEVAHTDQPIQDPSRSTTFEKVTIIYFLPVCKRDMFDA